MHSAIDFYDICIVRTLNDKVSHFLSNKRKLWGDFACRTSKNHVFMSSCRKAHVFMSISGGLLSYSGCYFAATGCYFAAIGCFSVNNI